MLAFFILGRKRVKAGVYGLGNLKDFDLIELNYYDVLTNNSIV